MSLRYQRFTFLVLLVLLGAFVPIARPVFAATRLVTNTNDSGSGSLRQAMLDAQPGDTIEFNNNFGIWRIQPLTPLPPLDKGNVTIDGTKNGGRIEIDGSLITSVPADGFLITSSNNVIKGLWIGNFKINDGLTATGGAGIHIVGTSPTGSDYPIVTGNQILDNHIGTFDGGTPAPNSNYGILVDARTKDTVISGNQVSWNGTTPFLANISIASLRGATVDTEIENTRVTNNIIGAATDGSVITNGNKGHGIIVGALAKNTVIGGTGANDGNLIVGHTASDAAGVYISGSSAEPNTGTVVAGNTIGHAKGTTTPRANYYGVRIVNANSATVGGPTSAYRNYIAGNNYRNVDISGVVASNNTVANNWIGLNSTGNVVNTPNVGVRVWNNPNNTTIGPGNVISGMSSAGIWVSAANGVTIKGNYVGTNTAGSQSNATFDTGQSSILIDNGTNIVVGGTTAADRNVIATGGSSRIGLDIQGSASGVVVQGNYFGVAASGTALLRTDDSLNSSGIYIGGSSTGTIVGSAASGAGNLFGGLAYGIQISGSSNNQIKGNTIGSSTTIKNGAYGIWLLDGATNNQIGGTAAGEGNQIGYNGVSGIKVEAASNNRIIGNHVHHNTMNGIDVDNSQGILISRTTTTSNTGSDGIVLKNNGNNNLAAPTNVQFVAVGQRLTGNTCANCTVEVFVHTSREDGEGPRYLTSGTADASGAFNISVAGCDRYLTVTTRNASNNTSPFYKPMVDAGVNGCTAPAPAIQLSEGTPTSSSGSPQVVAPGSSVTYSHTLTNIGSAEGTFTLSRTSSQGWASTPNPSSVTLGAGLSTTIQVTVNVPAGAAGNTLETTTLTAAVAGQTSVSRTDYTRAQQIAGVAISPLGATSKTVNPGNFVEYTFVVTNTGNASDTFNFSAVSTAGSATATFPGGTSCSLAAGASCTRTVRVAVASGSGDLSDTTTVTATSQFNTNVKQSTSFITQIQQVPVPQISAGSTQTASPPATVQFVHTISNVGLATGDFNVSVTPSPSRPGWNFTLSSTGPFTLAPNATQTVTLTVTVPAGASVGEDVDAVVKVTTAGGLEATATDTVQVALVPNLSFSAATQTPINGQPGQTVVFTHTLTNNGNGPDSFTVAMTSTAGLINLSRTPTGQINLAKGQSVQVVVQAQVANGVSAGDQTIGVTAQRTSAPLQAVTRVDTVQVSGAAVPQLSSTQTQTATLPLPSTVSFVHTLTNIGNMAGTFTVNATGPAGWTITPDSPACLSNLTPSSTCQITVQAQVPAGTLSGYYNVTISASADNTASVTDRVYVPPAPGLVLAPNHNGNADPGEVFTYTHTLTNTGNITDSFEISLSLDSGWGAQASPAIVTNVPPGETRQVDIQVNTPVGLVAGSTGTITVTARSMVIPFPTAQVVDVTTINAKPGATLDPETQLLSANPTQTLSDTVTFMHTLRNSGSMPLSYTLLVDTPPAGWVATLLPTEVGPLDPGDETTVQLQVSVPPGTPNGTEITSTLRVQQFGGPATDLAVAYDRTLVGPQYGAMLTPQINQRDGLPGETMVYTHTLRNTGIADDTFVVRAIAPNGWETFVSPPSISLPRNATTTITVTINIPTSAISTTKELEVDKATVIVRSVRDSSTAPAIGQEWTSVLQVAGVEISPPRVQLAVPGRNIEFLHRLDNTGNGLDTFTITATPSGDAAGWTVTVNPPSITLGHGQSYPVVQVLVSVPANAPPDASGFVQVRATSQSNPNVSHELTDIIRSPDLAGDIDHFIFMPAIVVDN